MPNYLPENKPLCSDPKERMPNLLNSGHIRCCYDWPGVAGVVIWDGVTSSFLPGMV